jgi:hypothetical protein
MKRLVLAFCLLGCNHQDVRNAPAPDREIDNDFTITPAVDMAGPGTPKDLLPTHDLLLPDQGGCTTVVGSDRTVTVDFSFDWASGLAIDGLELLVTYPSAQVNLPGIGSDDPRTINAITDRPQDNFFAAYDDNQSVHMSMISLAGFPNNQHMPRAIGKAMVIHFQDCSGATPPAPSDFMCQVVSASDQNGNDLKGVDCPNLMP